jgi:hypothetical protein
LVGFGLLVALSQLFHFPLLRFLWPFFVIVPGALLFLVALSVKGQSGEPLVVLASMVTMVGTLLLYQNTTGHWQSWAYAWALVAPTSIGLGQIVYGSLRGLEHLVRVGIRLTVTGSAIFLIGAAFFELVIGIRGFGGGGLGWALLLIGLGALLILRSLVGRRSDDTEVGDSFQIPPGSQDE